MITAIGLGRWFLLAATVFSALAQAPGAPQASPAAETRPARFKPGDFTEDGMNRRLREFLPLLEDILGAPFGEPPRVRAASPHELGAIVFEEMLILRDRMPGAARGGLLRAVVKGQTAALGRQLFAKVDVAHGVIYVVPENFLERMDDPAAGEAAGSQNMLDAVLLHEATHVWQHRRAPGGLAAYFGAPKSVDEMQCLNSVTEGHADVVTRLALTRLGRADDFAAYRRVQSVIPRFLRERADARTLAYHEALSLSPYLEGERFIEGLARRGDVRSAFARAFAAPPRTRHEVADPDLYADPEGRVVDTFELDARLQRIFKERKEPSESIGLPATVVRAELAPLGEETAARLVSDFAGGATVATKPAKAALNQLSLLTLKPMYARDAAGAARLFHAYVAAWEAETEASAAPDGPSPSEVADVPVDGGRGRRLKRTVTPERGKPYDVVAVLMVRGRVVCEARATVCVDSEESLTALARAGLEAAETAPERGVASRPTTPASRPAAERLRGRVVYRPMLEPVPKFEVHLWTAPPDRRIIVVEGRDGAFEVDLADPEGALVGAVIVDGERIPDVAGTRPVRKDGGLLLDLKLIPPEFAAVRVVDDAGDPIAGAELYASDRYRPKDAPPTRPAFSPPFAVTGSDGVARFRRDGVLGDRWKDAVEIVVAAAGRADEAVETARVSNADAPSDVVLGPGGGLSVMIEGALDRDDLVYTVEPSTEDASRADRVVVRPSRDALKIDGLAPGDYVVAAWSAERTKVVVPRKGRVAHVAAKVVAGEAATAKLDVRAPAGAV
ncbi:MAG TPA: hypothetical protein VEI02_04210, partial [Planctomycetota bacterium]|nr:hypothetical protein [Planctomycetota bacterium]